jgi:protein-L-isoaspartate(D-aspartate) O-methyltransferase
MPLSFLSIGYRAVRCVSRGVVIASLIAMNAPAAQDRYATDRKAMLDDIARTTRDTRFETGREALSERVMEAMARVPRHRLVPPAEEPHAYRDRPLSIGLGQTISQPFIVALMTDLLDVKTGEKVLEIGTGSGYQAAILAELGARVFTIEILEPLGREAARRLGELGYHSVQTRIGDGYRGWPGEAPFDAIIVTAAAPELPPALADQLKPGGKLVIPLGSQSGLQTLYLIQKQPDGKLSRRAVLSVRFVPMTGGK